MKLLSVEVERAAFLQAHAAWASGDFNAFMALIDADIVYTVNVDGYLVPYASSAVGKDDVQMRLQLLLDTFFVTRFEIESVVHETDFSRTLVHGCYRHRRTGEILDIKVRFVGWVRNGLVTRLEEYHDAAYVRAFERFVGHLQDAAAEIARNQGPA